MSFEIDRHRYAELFGPTEGDSIRLGDTDLFIKIEKDYTGYGNECKFGGGKTLRDGMGQNAIQTNKNPEVADFYDQYKVPECGFLFLCIYMTILLRG